MDVGNDGTCKILSSRLATQILGPDFAVLKYSVESIVDHITVGRQVDVTQHFCTAQEHSSWVGNIFAYGFGKGVTCTLKNKHSLSVNLKVHGNIKILTGSNTTVSAE